MSRVNQVVKVSALVAGLVSGALFLASSVAMAGSGDPMIGTWKTQPDRKNLTSHIVVTRCGEALCGKVAKAFDPAGKEVKTANVGKRLFWDLRPAGGGRYEGGTVWVPLLNIQAKATAVLDGGTLTVRGCKAGVCDGQVWRRVK